MAQHRGLTGQSIALVAVFAGLIAASTLVPEVTLIGGVPITLQTFAIVLAGLVLGPWRALAAVTLYVLLGLVVPVYANGAVGLAVLTGPTGGYLIGFILAATVIGALAQLLARRGVLARRRTAAPALIAVGLVSIPLVYAVGVPWLSWRLGIPLLPTGCTSITDADCVSGLTVGVIPFLPGDIIKVVVAGLVAAAIHRAYPGLLGSARAATAASSPVTDGTDEGARATA
ncbi:biotin transporter BioY [Demequina silvatica]|uniref:biotin transporter BioY n=1 Tax=Demequina silvatica TaxID=1638988 RepID=UPI000783F1CB|nr:biotin transporter BioY [Demequina silvatica]